ncbi:MAG: DUF4388 domain-containing protein [Calditrichaceae bacterium]
MKDVFVISDNQENFNLFYANYGHLPIHFSWAGEIDDALTYLKAEKPSFLFLVLDQLDLLLAWSGELKAKFQDIPLICFIGRLDRAGRKSVRDAGAKEIIQLPMNRSELEKILISIMHDETESGEKDDQTQGSLEDFNLIDLLQSFEEGKKNGVLILENGPRKGDIEFNKGKVVNARFQSREPLESITIMSTWFKGQFTAKLDSKRRRERVNMTTQQITFECMNYLNLQEQLFSNLPDRSARFYTAPDMDYEDIGPSDRQILLTFKDGFTIDDILEIYIGNTNLLLERVDKWIRKKWLLRKADYDIHLKEIRDYEKMSGLQKFINKVFTRVDEDEKSAKKVSRKDKSNDITQIPVVRQEYLFDNRELLISFIIALEN